MSDPIVSPPTLAGFIAWARVIMGIPTAAMSDDDPGWNYAFYISMDWVPTDLSSISGDMYTLAVYNWAGSSLLQFQQDYTGQIFFTNARTAFKIDNFVAGVVGASADSSTSGTYIVGTGLSNLDAISLQRVKDPYGRQAIAIMQALGTLWGLT